MINLQPSAICHLPSFVRQHKAIFLRGRKQTYRGTNSTLNVEKCKTYHIWQRQGARTVRKSECGQPHDSLLLKGKKKCPATNLLQIFETPAGLNDSVSFNCPTFYQCSATAFLSVNYRQFSFVPLRRVVHFSLTFLTLQFAAVSMAFMAIVFNLFPYT